MDAKPLAEHDNDPLAALRELRGKRVSLATVSYGDEFVMGFGERRDKPIDGTVVPWAEWMLFTRSTPWAFETDEGVVATNRNRLNAARLSVLQRAVEGAHVLEACLRTRVLSLGIELSNRSRLTLMPRRNGQTHDEVWALTTPQGTTIRAMPATGLEVVRDDAQFSTEAGDDLSLEEWELQGAWNPDFAFAAAAPELPGSTASPESRKLFDALKKMSRSSGFAVFGPMFTPNSLADFVLVTSAGKTVLLQIKTSSRPLASTVPLPRIVLATDLSAADKALVENDPRSVFLPLREASAATVAELAERLSA